MRNRFSMSFAAAALSAGMILGQAPGSIKGTVTVAAASDSSNVVVYVDKLPGRSFQPPAEPVVLDQSRLTFIPHVLPVLVGTTVAFPNSDEVRHNVFSPSRARLFNLGIYPRGVTRSVRFDQPGEVALLCNVHPEMSAYIIVVETPYFAVTGPDGSFQIQGVPAGTYTLRTWHEKNKPASAAVTVKPDRPATVRLRLGEPAAR